MRTLSAKRDDAPASTPRLTDAERLLQTQIARLEEQFNELRQQVRQAQQVASLGTAAAMLAHEYNNLVSPIVGYARSALDSDDHELMRKALEATLQRSSIITAMADRILNLAVQEPQSLQAVELKTVVVEAVACMVRDPAKDGITLDIDIDGDVKAWADQKQLIQVFFNLLLNARQALTGHGGRITIGAAGKDDERVEVWVRDTGCGIPRELINSIFEPFVTTKTCGSTGSGKGAGLGLAICHDIVEEHRGDIVVESEPGKGTTFTITLPAAN
ncbi:MAG: two-component system sensor histidine kinase NtrB [Planctomycetota bacterium]|jgi:signal transduction histidine kinase